VTFVDTPILFDCEGDELVAVLSVPERPFEVGVVVVVGGPQYRVGSHRQFTFLARALASEGIACLRFDCRGMGDSEGDVRSFETIDADIHRAVEELSRRVPAVKSVVLWGLCDGASASLLAIRPSARIEGVIALNPWVRSETSLDRALVRHYSRAVSEFSRRVSGAVAVKRKTASATGHPVRDSYQDRMCDGLKGLNGHVLFILSGKDLTAQEYATFALSNSRWRQALQANPLTVTETLAAADHTFSDQASRLQVEALSCRFVRSLRDRPALAGSAVP
jgi:exosortase A-associated hydrolase 1